MVTMEPPKPRRRRVCGFAFASSALIVLTKEIFFPNSQVTWNVGGHRSLQALPTNNNPPSTVVTQQQLVKIAQPQQQQQQRKQLEFVHITKTGGSAIERAAAFAGINWGACRHHLFRKVGCLEPPDLPYNASEFQAGFQGKPYFGESWHCPHHWMTPEPHQSSNNKATFCVIRNPYDRYVSEYGYVEGTIGGQVLDATAMNEFIQTTIRQYSTRPFWPGHFLPMHYYIYNEAGTQVIDHVLRYENLQVEFNALMDAYQLDVVLPPKRQQHGINSGSSLTKKQLTAATIAAINEYAKRDFELFGYQKVQTADEFLDGAQNALVQ